MSGVLRRLICKIVLSLALECQYTFGWDQYAELRSYSFDGTGNHVDNLGSVGSPFLKSTDFTALSNQTLPSARTILQQIYLAGESSLSSLGLNHAWAYWGLLQYFDFVDVIPSTTEYNIPCDDGVSDSMCPVDTCDATLNDDIYVQYFACEKDSDSGIPLNGATAFADLDCVYGRTDEASNLLRSFEGGRLNLTDQGLPQVEVDPDSGETNWVIADQRFTQVPGAFALLVLMLREHNRRADELNNSTYLAELEDTYGCTPVKCTEWGDEELFQAARTYVIASYQHIALNEYLPILVGISSSSSAAHVYDDTIEPGIDILASMALRWPYSALGLIDEVVDSSWSPNLQFGLSAVGSICSYDDLNEVIQSAGIDGILRGMIVANGAEVDAYLPPRTSTSCLDAPVIDIQTGRDFGLPSYNDARESLGLSRASSFEDITTDSIVLAALEDLYLGDVELVDMLVGGLIEEKDDGAVLGELFTTVLYNQLITMKPSDSLWHLHTVIFEDSRATSLSIFAERNQDPIGAFGDNIQDTVYPVDSFSAVHYDGATESSTTTLVFVEDVFEMTWTIDEDEGTITFNVTITGMGAGYFGVGIGDKMIGSDIFAFVSFEGDEVTITDRFGNANDLPVLDEEFGGSQDTVKITSYSSSDQWIVVFMRNLNASATDEFDQSITDSDISFLWSYNLEEVAQHAFTNRGVYNINFFSGTSTEVSDSSDAFFLLHGLVMVVAWGICGPMAFYVVRYKKHWTNWLEIHEILASFAAEASLPIAIAAITSTTGMFVTVHGRIGLALLICISLQFLSGLLRKAGIRNRGNSFFGSNYDRVHQVNKYLHRSMGRFIILFGLFNVILGLEMTSPSSSTLVLSSVYGSDPLTIQLSFFDGANNIYWSILAMVALLFVGSEINLQIQMRYFDADAEQRLNRPTFTMEQFNQRILEGDKLVLVHDAVIDISSYINVHPGGSKVLRESIGTNVTKEILGKRGVVQSISDQQHLHSGKAWMAIQQMTVAYIGGSTADSIVETPRRALLTGQRAAGFSLKSSNTSIVSSIPFIKCVLRSKEILTTDKDRSPVVSFVFEPMEEGIEIDPFQIGYYHKFRAILNNNVIQRSYTPVAYPLLRSKPKGFQYYIRLHPEGQMSNALRNLKINDCIRIQGPFEINEMYHHYDNVYLICAGTGVNPMIQFLRGHFKRLKALSEMNQQEDERPQYKNLNQSYWSRGGVNPLNVLFKKKDRLSLGKAESAEKKFFDDDIYTKLKEGVLKCSKSMVLLWQIHSNNDNFCFRDLEELLNYSYNLASDDPLLSSSFYYTCYTTTGTPDQPGSSFYDGSQLESTAYSLRKDWRNTLKPRKKSMISKSNFQGLLNTLHSLKQNLHNSFRARSVCSMFTAVMMYILKIFVYVVTGFEVYISPQSTDPTVSTQPTKVLKPSLNTVQGKQRKSIFEYLTPAKVRTDDVPRKKSDVSTLDQKLLAKPLTFSSDSQLFHSNIASVRKCSEEGGIQCNDIVEGKIDEVALRLNLEPLLKSLKTKSMNEFDQTGNSQDSSNTGIFVSGPSGFVDNIELFLNSLGIPDSLIHYLD